MVVDPFDEYVVVRDDEEQYSVGRDVPGGWHPAGFGGTKEQFLGHVDVVGTGMCPRGLRSAMEWAS